MIFTNHVSAIGSFLGPLFLSIKHNSTQNNEGEKYVNLQIVVVILVPITLFLFLGPIESIEMAIMSM